MLGAPFLVMEKVPGVCPSPWGRDGRRFYLGNTALQTASQAAIDDLDAKMKPGERLVVGPADLSRTIYSDVVFYYLFPE